MSYLKRIETHTRLSNSMADALGVDLVEATQRGLIPEQGLREVVTTCMGCRETGACQEWLGEHEGETPSEAPEYCRNKPLLDRLAGAID